MSDPYKADFYRVGGQVIDKLFKEGFPKSDTAFLFQNIIDRIDIKNLKVSEDDEYAIMFFSSHYTNLSQERIRPYLIDEGFIRPFEGKNVDTQMTDKGILAVECGGIDEFYSMRHHDNYIKEQLTKSTLATNKSVRRTNCIQIVILVAMALLAVFTLVIQYSDHRDKQANYNDSQLIHQLLLNHTNQDTVISQEHFTR